MKSVEIVKKRDRTQTMYYHWAVFYLTLMTIQLVGIEGWGTSWLKLFFMCLTPFMLLSLPKINVNAIVCGILFELSLWGCSMFNGNRVEWTTLIYSSAFVSTFCFYASLLKNNAFSGDTFISYLRRMIFIFAVMIPIQQICAIVGIRLSILNIHGFPWGWKFPSLFIEPSHAARIMLVYCYAYIEMLQWKMGKSFDVKLIFQQDKGFFFLIMYAMMSMGSATAYAALAVLLAVILLKSKLGIKFVIVFLIAGLLPLLLQIEAVQRVVATTAAAATFDQELVTKTDSSASLRVNTLLAFLSNFNLSSSAFWFGGYTYGSVGIIVMYGFITFLFQLILLFVNAFRGNGIEWLICFVFLAMTLGNFAYVWAAVLIWVTVKHFYSLNKSAVSSEMIQNSNNHIL